MLISDIDTVTLINPKEEESSGAPTVMALLASSAPATAMTPKFQIKKQSAPFRHLNRHECPSRVIIRALAGEPNRAKLQLGNVSERLLEAVPEPVKEFPWKKAENVLLGKLLSLGKKGLKWSLVTFFIFSSLSDIALSVSSNQELTIPFGLLIGCLLAEFLRETLHQMFPESEASHLQGQLLSISCFFVIVKFIFPQRMFLLHVANGGLMQRLWPLRNYVEENGNDKYSEENSISSSESEGTLAIDSEL